MDGSYLNAKVKRLGSDAWEDKGWSHNIITNAGRDFLHNQGYITGQAGTAVLQYIAVTSDTTAPAAGDTTLPSEISTNGLARAQATVDTHTAGTNTSTVGITFTATGSLNAVQKGALFTASSNGTMANEATFSSTNLVNGDQKILGNSEIWFTPVDMDNHAWLIDQIIFP